MTIGQYVDTYRGKRVVSFNPGDKVTQDDVIYRLHQEYESEQSQRELMDELFSQIDLTTLDALIIGPWNESYEEGPSGYLETLIEKRDQLGALKALFVGDMTYEDCEISWILQDHYNPLLAAFPRLESLRVRGSTQLRLEPFEHAHLQELIIECGGLPSTVVQAIAASTLPALQHLELWLGSDNYGFDGDLATYQQLLHALGPERLSYLGLRNASISDELAVWLATQPWLGSLRVLDLSLGTLGDTGAQALFESPHLGTLERIDLSHHYISPEWQEKLKSLPCTVVLDNPVDEDPQDEGDRYVAVSE